MQLPGLSCLDTLERIHSSHSERTEMNKLQHIASPETIHLIYNGDAVEATCALCNETIVKWDFTDSDGDRAKRVSSGWAIERIVKCKVVKDTTCKPLDIEATIG